MEKMQEIRDSGVTLFYVSHAAGSVRKMCDRVLVLEKGALGFDGDVDEGIKYLHYDDDEDDGDEAGARRRDPTPPAPLATWRARRWRRPAGGSACLAGLDQNLDIPACRLAITAL